MEVFIIHSFPRDFWILIGVWYIIGLTFSFGILILEYWVKNEKELTLANVIASMLLGLIGPLLPITIALSVAAVFFTKIYQHLQHVVIKPRNRHIKMRDNKK